MKIKEQICLLQIILLKIMYRQLLITVDKWGKFKKCKKFYTEM